MEKTGPKPGGSRLEMTEERKEVFLTELRTNDGTITAAAAVASPRSLAAPRSHPGYSSFRQLMKRDSAFSAAVADVLDQIRGDIYAEIFSRAMHGTSTPVFQKGERATDHDGSPASITTFDNKLLLRLASKLDPEGWSESRTVNINHQGAGQTGLQIAPSDLKLLSADQKLNLRDILATIASARGEPKAIEHQDVVDAEFEVVTDAEIEVEGDAEIREYLAEHRGNCND